MAHVYDNKSLTDSDKEEIRKGAAGIDHWSANSNKADMQVLAGLLESKLNAYKTQWNNAKPSPAIPDFPVISPQSADVINRMSGKDPNQVAPQAVITPGQSRQTLPGQEPPFAKPAAASSSNEDPAAKFGGRTRTQ